MSKREQLLGAIAIAVTVILLGWPVAHWLGML